MGRKKSFIDKKNSATFKLLARDTSTLPEAAATPVPPTSDRVFVRVDNNLFHARGIFEDNDGGNDRAGLESVGLKGGDDVDSIFSDAPGDTNDEGSFSKPGPSHAAVGRVDRTSNFLPDEVRKEILELGLADDGYNYLKHLREISNSGAGSAYYQNSKARLDLVPLDVKAYDASRLKIIGVESNEKSIYAFASKAVGVKVQKVVDPDVSRLLDDSDLSRFASDTEEDLDEDFVFKANFPEGSEGESEEMGGAKPGSDKAESKMALTKVEQQDDSSDEDSEDELDDDDEPRTNRLLDEQFDLLTHREYDDTYSDDDGSLVVEDETLVAKLHDTLKECKVDDLEVEEQYRVPGDYVHKQEAPSIGIQLDDSADVLRRCREYAEKYCNETENNEELTMVEESSDESEVWDCETIVSTYSNLDNHPGKIQAPENSKRKFAKDISVDSIEKVDMIELRGKEKLPVEFLPHAKKVFEKLKKPVGLEKQKSKPRREESKDEKKERKVAVKEDRREARRAKKELKGLYRCETYKAQKVAAVSMPSAIHLM